MALSIGIIGLPNVGKSSLFNALTDANALVANYPFATIEPNSGVVPVPDPRLDELAKIYNTSRVVPASLTFVDIAGLVAGASHGEGLGNQFLAHIRGVKAICHVVRVFEDQLVARAGSADPARDIEIINTELALADLQTVNNRLPRLEKEVKANAKLKPLLDTLNQVKAWLESGTPIHGASVIDQGLIADLFLLTAKPVIYVFNVNERSLANAAKSQELTDLVDPAPAIFISAKLENELRGLDSADRAELLNDYGQGQSGLEKLIQPAYSTLGLQSFLTAGQKEIRAWTITKGATARQAAGTVHSDMQRGFIAAQVVDYKQLVSAGSLAAARAAGQVRTEGQDYIMQPNDVVEFRFNV